MPRPSFWLCLPKLVQAGARLHPLESMLVYGCGISFFAVFSVDTTDWVTAISKLATTNALVQIALFVVVVQIPCYRTGVMSNVDLAWPTGLVLLAVQVLLYHHRKDAAHEEHHQWWSSRSLWVGLALLLHGGRMAGAAAVMFFPYDWPDGDLPRYQYARKRWIDETNAPHLWWIKQQHETIMQAYANSVLIAAPVIWVATNPNPEPLRPLELAGLVGWGMAWALENLADTQKLWFLRVSTRNGDAHQAVLGCPPYDGWEYGLWTRSRHPNYFFEFACWNFLALLSLPSAWDLAAVLDTATDGSYETVHSSTAGSLLLHWVPRCRSSTGIWVVLACLVRVVYDCLMYWTGAEPAEFRSVQKRPLYKEHQTRTNVLVPMWIPGLDHHRTPGWPMVVGDHHPDHHGATKNS